MVEIYILIIIGNNLLSLHFVERLKMKILIISTDNADIAIAARIFLQRCDRYLMVASVSSGLEETGSVVLNDALSRFNLTLNDSMTESLESVRKEPWNFVITLGRITDMKIPKFSSKVGRYYHFSVEIGNPDNPASYTRMCEELKACMYNFYKHHILEPEDGQTCPCGVNRYCKCH